jgi:hypothetical protein
MKKLLRTALRARCRCRVVSDARRPSGSLVNEGQASEMDGIDMPLGLNPSDRDPEFILMRRRSELLHSLIYPQTAEERATAIRKAGR